MKIYLLGNKMYYNLYKLKMRINKNNTLLKKIAFLHLTQ